MKMRSICLIGWRPRCIMYHTSIITLKLSLFLSYSRHQVCWQMKERKKERKTHKKLLQHSHHCHANVKQPFQPCCSCVHCKVRLLKTLLFLVLFDASICCSCCLQCYFIASSGIRIVVEPESIPFASSVCWVEAWVFSWWGPFNFKWWLHKDLETKMTYSFWCHWSWVAVIVNRQSTGKIGNSFVCM